VISVLHHSSDAFALNGMNHFLEKYGLSATFNDKSPVISVVYGDAESVRSEFTVRIADGKVKKCPSGWITFAGEKAPIFEVPKKTPGGRALVIFTDGKRKFPCASVKKGTITIGFDLFSEVGHVLSGSLEGYWSGLSLQEKKEVSKTPTVDLYEKILFDALVIVCRESGVPLVHKSFWPDGKKFAVCLTHDVDEIRKTYQHITRPLKLMKNGDLRGIRGQITSMKHKIQGNEPYWTFDELMAIEKKLGVKSTFFFLRETAPVKLHDPKTWKHYGRRYDFCNEKICRVIENLRSGGWEVGLHGSYESYKKPDMLKEEKSMLEGILKERVNGTRQHNLNLQIPETFLHHEKIGFEYDTSLGHKDSTGFRWGTCFPFHPVNEYEKKGMKLLEIPLSVMDIVLFSTKDHWKTLTGIESEVEKYGGALTLLWHHTVFNEHDFPGWGAVYEKIVRVSNERGAWVTNCREICNWWKRREKTKVSSSFSEGRLMIKASPAGQEHFIKIYKMGKGKIAVKGGKVVREDNKSVTIKTLGRAEVILGC